MRISKALVLRFTVALILVVFTLPIFMYGTVQAVPTSTSGHNPVPGAIDVPIDTNIVVHVLDAANGVDQATIVMTVNGSTVSPDISGDENDYTLTYDPPADFAYNQVVNVTVDASDQATPANPMTQDVYSFTTIRDTYSLTVNTAGSGTVDRNPLPPYYVGDNTLVTLTANPAAGWSFSGWSGAISGTTNPQTVTMDGNKTVTATFTHNAYTLTVNTIGNGTVGQNPPPPYYIGDNTIVTLTANADPGWSFTGWSGAISGTTNPQTITMDNNKTVTATFTQDSYTLTVSTDGNGTVALDPAGGIYPSGTDVTLTANADPGWTFTGWSDDLSGSDNPETITMDGDRTVTATFTQDEYTLDIDINPNNRGTVTRDPDQATYHYGDSVTLTPIPDTDWFFASWGEDLSGSTNPETIIMDGNKTVTATFTQDEYLLTVNIVGNGTVDQDPQPPYIIDDDTVVTLTANADPGWSFSGWSVDLSGTTNPETITMDGNKTVTATFTRDTYTLTVNIVGSGTVTKDISPPYYVGDNTEVKLTANPAAGGSFTGWSGALSGTNKTETITMDSDKTVTATFTQTGGGGGGGGGGGVPMGVTFLTGKVNAQSMFVENITAQSHNKKVTITIPQGTIGRTSIGAPLGWISIVPTNDYPIIPAEYLPMNGLVYDVSPHRTTFDPDIKITIEYNPSALDAGIDELDLCIATCDDKDGEWYPLESHVVPEDNTVWAEISHFSLYAVMVDTRPTADIAVTRLTITPEEIYEGEEATVGALLVNSGGSAGSYEATLKINGIVQETRVVDVAGNESVAISFDLTGLGNGNHQVAIGELEGTLRILEVVELKPAVFTVSSLAITPGEADIGEYVNISIRVDNTGERGGEYQLVCKVDGVVVGEKEVRLAGGSGESTVFTTTFDEAGNKTIEINGLTGSLVVREKEEEPSLEPEPGTVAEIQNTDTLPIRPPFNWWLFGIIIIGGIIIISMLVYFFALRIGSIKE